MLDCSLSEAPIRASVQKPRSTHILPPVLGSDRLQGEAVLSLPLPGCPQLSISLSPAVLGPDGQNACRANAGQLNISPEPGYREEPFLQVVEVYVAEQRQLLPLLQSIRRCRDTHRQGRHVWQHVYSQRGKKKKEKKQDSETRRHMNPVREALKNKAERFDSYQYVLFDGSNQLYERCFQPLALTFRVVSFPSL